KRALLLALACACGPAPGAGPDSGSPPDSGVMTDSGVPDAGAPVDSGVPDAGAPDSGEADAGPPDAGMLPALPFGEAVVSFTPGQGAGFGQNKMPGVVLGPPQGQGDSSGSTDVVSLGNGGEIVLETGVTIVDGPGVDLIVFENAFIGFTETGIVAV